MTEQPFLVFTSCELRFCPHSTMLWATIQRAMGSSVGPVCELLAIADEGLQLPCPGKYELSL
jgi:hypothetical protein